MLDKILDSLNEEQLDAVKTTEGVVRVIAGAGSGKTRALTSRYAYLLEAVGTPASRILSVTFTNKAANEMKSRIMGMVGENACLPYIMTFHSFCNRFLRAEIEKMGYPLKFKIIDPDDQSSILKKVYADLGISAKELPYKKCMSDIIGQGMKYGKRSLLPQYEEILQKYSVEEINTMMICALDQDTQIALCYLREQKRDYCLDYEDLLNFTLYLLRTDKEVREFWQNGFDYVQVDEFQDVSMREVEIVATLAENSGNLFVVGDDSQSIYSFRLADVNCIVKLDTILEELYKKAIKMKTLFLKTNYRSTKNIVDVTNSLIKHNQTRVDKDLVTPNEYGAKALHYHGKSVYQEGEWVAKRILSLKDKYDYSDIAVLYRSNSTSRVIEEKLIASRIPYQVLSGVSFYQRKEIKDIMSVLSLVAFGDNVAFRRIVKNFSLGIGPKKVDFLEEYALKNNCGMYDALVVCKAEKMFKSTQASYLVNLIERLKKQQFELTLDLMVREVNEAFDISADYMAAGEEDRVENIMELMKSAKYYEYLQNEKVLLADYLSNMTLYTEQDKEEDAKAVKLMTVHASKGLEYKVVFLIGMNEGVLPSSRAKSPEDIEEERRIAYVGMTRAKELLFLTDAEGDNYDYSKRIPSRFLFNIERDLYNSEGVIDPYLLKMAKQQIAASEGMMGIKNQKVEPTSVDDLLEFAKEEKSEPIKAGDRVKHPIFGEGKVLNIEMTTYIVMFDTGAIKGIAISAGKLSKV